MTTTTARAAETPLTPTLSPLRGAREKTLSRRAFSAAALAICAAPFAARAQAPKTVRLAMAATGFAVDAMSMTGDSRFRAFLTEMRRLGYVEGENLAVSRWSTSGITEAQFNALARQVVASGPDVIFAGGARLVVALKNATRTIPIVFTASDPISWRLIDGLSRPGGNLTGFSTDAGPEMVGKRLQLLFEAAPRLAQIAFLTTPESWTALSADLLRDGARTVGLPLIPALVDGVVTNESVTRALAGIPDPGRTGVVINQSAEYVAVRQALAAAALAAGLPTIGQQAELAQAGCLMSYGPDYDSLTRAAAGYVDRIVRGANPADLPVQLPTTFDLTVNLNTARALGITMPEHLMVFATEIIE